MTEPKRKLRINMIELESAIEHRDPTAEIIYFLDLETGEVEMTTGVERRLLERIYKQYLDEETHAVDWPAVLPQLNIPEWEQDVLVKADLNEAGYGTRYIAIPQVESFEGYNEIGGVYRYGLRPVLAKPPGRGDRWERRFSQFQRSSRGFLQRTPALVPV